MKLHYKIGMCIFHTIWIFYILCEQGTQELVGGKIWLGIISLFLACGLTIVQLHIKPNKTNPKYVAYIKSLNWGKEDVKKMILFVIMLLITIAILSIFFYLKNNW